VFGKVSLYPTLQSAEIAHVRGKWKLILTVMLVAFLENSVLLVSILSIIQQTLIGD
jgi:hypothetical protein